MEFRSIDEVSQKLGISAEHPEDIKREVRRRLLEVHPDALAGAGLPEDKAKSEEALLLTAALNYLNKPDHSTDIVPRETETELIKLVRDLVQVNQNQGSQSHLQEEVVRREHAAEQTLSQASAARVEQIKSAGRVPVISLTAVSVLLTALWVLPTTVQNNLVLGRYINVTSVWFAQLWLASLLLTAGTWVVFKWRSQAEELVQRTLNLETTQNTLFSSFLQDRHQLARSMSELVGLVEDLTGYVNTAKYLEDQDDEQSAQHYSDVIESTRSEIDQKLEEIREIALFQLLERNDTSGVWQRLLNWRSPVVPETIDADVRSAEWELLGSGSDWRMSAPGDDYKRRYLTEFQKADFVSYVEHKSVDIKQGIRRQNNLNFLSFLLSTRGPIDAELAQNIANLILTRAEAKGTVKPISSRSLDQRYSLDTREDTAEGES